MSNYYPGGEAQAQPKGFIARVAAWLRKEQRAAQTTADLREEGAREESKIQSHDPPMPPY